MLEGPGPDVAEGVEGVVAAVGAGGTVALVEGVGRVPGGQVGCAVCTEIGRVLGKTWWRLSGGDGIRDV